MKRSYSIICLVLASLWFLPEASGQNSGPDFQVNLTATIRSNTVLLYWNVYGWPTDLYGFNIKRRATGDENWDLLNQQPISPELSPLKNWSLQGLNQNQINQYIADYGSYLQTLNLSQEETLSQLHQNNGIRLGDRLAMLNDFGLAVTMGFGFIDNNYMPGAQFEYAIHFVTMDGNEKPAPLSQVALSTLQADPSTLDVQLGFKGFEEGIRVEWTIPRTASAAKGLIGFNVYRNGTRVNASPIASVKKDANTLYYAFIDLEGDYRSNTSYEVKPVNAFQEELGVSSEPYRAADHLPMIQPQIFKPEMEGNVNVRISWDLKSIDSRIQNLKLQRTVQGANAFEEIAPNLSTSAGTYIDSKPMEYGKIYQYMLTAIDHLGREWNSNVETILYMGLIPPQPLTGLKGEFFQEGSKPTVMLSWNPHSGNGIIPSGYKISTDEIKAGRLLESTHGLVRGNQVKYTLRGESGRKVSFKVVPVTKHGAEGEGMTIEVHIPTQKMPSIRDFRVKLNPDNSVDLSWSYDDVVDLKGFELYMNDKKVLGREKLKAETRKYKFGQTKADQNGYAKFELRAIGQGIFSRKSLARTLKLNRITDIKKK